MPATKTYVSRKYKRTIPISTSNRCIKPTIIDRLFAKNIEKRKESMLKDLKMTTRSRHSQINGITSQDKSDLLNLEESLFVLKDTTFDKLLKAPNYNSVQYASRIFGDSSSDMSKSLKHTNDTKQFEQPKVELKPTRKRKREPKIVKKRVYTKRSDKKKPEQHVNNEKSRSYLYDEINHSLTVEKEVKRKSNYNSNTNNQSARKYTNVPASLHVPKASHLSTTPNDIFRNSFKQCMRAESTPKYIPSSTPIARKYLKYDHLEMSPISSRSYLNSLSLSLYKFDKSLQNHSKLANDTKLLAEPIVLLQQYDLNQLKNTSAPLQNIKPVTSDSFQLNKPPQKFHYSTRFQSHNNNQSKINRSPFVLIEQLKTNRKPLDLSKLDQSARVLLELMPQKNLIKIDSDVIEISDNESSIIEISEDNLINHCPSPKPRRRYHKPLTIELSSDDNLIENTHPSCSPSPKSSRKQFKSPRYQKTIKLADFEEFAVRNTSIIMAQIDDDDNRKSIVLRPGKAWFRSLSILRRSTTNLQPNKKGRKWRTSVFDILEENKSALIGKHNTTRQRPLNIHRTSLKIVRFEGNHSCSSHSGYVSTLTNESILDSFDKLSLTTNVEDHEETARQIILKRCGQTSPIPFHDCYNTRTLTKCRKIGEGVYGEVFMYQSMDQYRVMKIIPIEGNLVVNGEHQKKFEEIITEIIIASELSNLRLNTTFGTDGFNELLKICCVQGKYPQKLVDLWDLYDEHCGSENDSPECFTENQLYIILELANGGQDLEAFRFNNAEQAYALFTQVVCTLAVAESALEFEHRDMHWGNILISPTEEPTTTYHLNGREFHVANKGVKGSIIDFTLSRLTLNKCCIYNDLALDPDLFKAEGDYQFDIYRLMRNRNQNNWQHFEPYSNILWLDYTLEKMISHLRYVRKNTKAHKSYIRKLAQIQKKILSFNSTTELLNSDVFSHVFL